MTLQGFHFPANLILTWGLICSLTRKRGHWFWNRGLTHTWHGIEENFMQSLSSFFMFFGVLFFAFFCFVFAGLFKALLTRAIIPSLLNSLDLPSYGLESRKKYTLRCCYAQRWGPGEKVFWKLFCLGQGQMTFFREGFAYGDWR